MNRLHYFSMMAIAGLILASCARPVANFITTPTEDSAPAEIAFSNESKNASIYHWDFGDGNQSTEISPTHAYLQSGNYEVTLIAKSEKGKENIKTARIMITPPKKCLVEIQTDYGNMVVELYDDTPKHRDNFYKLAEEGFYNDLLFHRVMSGFMIQGGDPLSKEEKPNQPVGTGGPGYQIPAEINSDFVHVKGALAAARQPDNVNPSLQSSGSQFYIVQGNDLTEDDVKSFERRTGIVYNSEQREDYIKYGGYPLLDGNYTVFGRVVSGLEVIDKIAACPTDSRNLPLEEVRMKMTTIK